jgi:uncharacterized protein YndB with AHSA1/START domain
MTAASKEALAGKKHTMSTPTDRTIRVERMFNAPRERVWKAHLEADQLAQWWGRGRTTIIEKLDVRKGGYWRFVVPSEYGPQGFGGRFREVTPMDRFSWSFEWDGMPGHVGVETYEFTDMANGQTKLVATSLFHTTEERDALLQTEMETGMTESYMALDRLLEQGA